MTTTTTDTTDNTMTTTKQTEPPALIFAVLNKEKTFIENLSIAGTKVDMNHLDDVLSGLYDPNDTNNYENGHTPSENFLLMTFGKTALSDMTKYFVLHSIYLALSTYTHKNTICDYFNEHIKQETGMGIYLRKTNSITRICFPWKRELFKCFGALAYSDKNFFSVYATDSQPNYAAGFRIWLRCELNAIAKNIKLIEPGLKALPEVLRLRSKEREETVTRKREFEAYMYEKIPYIGSTASYI